MSDEPSSWLNRTVLGAGLTSFLADVGYEMASAILPAFLLMLGLPQDVVARVIGLIEGTADLLSNAVKIAVGWYSDRIGQRKAFVVGGYALTGSAFALCALAMSWPLVMVAKSLAWIGKGLRQPLRNAILADAVDENRSRQGLWLPPGGRHSRRHRRAAHCFRSHRLDAGVLVQDWR